MKKIQVVILGSCFFVISFLFTFASAQEIISKPFFVENDLSAVTVISPESVLNKNDLEVFANDLISQDKNIKFIKFSSDLTELRYEYPGKLFGFFPIRTWISAFISRDNAVKVKFPWHHIFVKKTVDWRLNEKEADLSKFQLDNFQGELQKQAWSLQLLSNILKTKHDTAMNIEG